MTNSQTRNDVLRAIESLDLVLGERDAIRETCDKQERELTRLRVQCDMLSGDLRTAETARDIYLEMSVEATARLEAFGQQLASIGGAVADAIGENRDKPFRKRIAASAHKEQLGEMPAEDEERLKHIVSSLAPPSFPR